MAWANNVLRVNLTEGTTSNEPLNMEWAGLYLGQRGLATKYLVEEIDPMCDALGPGNKLIMTTGPLTGTMASTGGRYSVVTKSPLTGAVACSNSGGFIGAELKAAGYDMIIFEGKSPRPVYLYVENDKVEIVSADEIWGQSVWTADEWLHKKYQDPLLRIAAVGRAAEKGCLYAAVVNDLHRAAGRSGVGTVMASKNLKAVAVRGTKGVGNIKDPGAFMQAVNAGKQVLAENAVTGQGLPTYGTQVLMNVINEVGAMPTRNMREVQFEGASKISAEAMHEPRESDGKPNLVTNAGCFGCTIACGRISTIDRGHFSIENKPQYWGASGGLEYEAAWALGSDTGVDDIDALTYANFICNEDGIDPISFGSTVAAAMELYQIGAITKEQTGGVELKFGSAEALTWATEVTCRGEGFGQDLGLGFQAPVREVRSSGPVNDGERSGIPRLRPARHPGHGPDLCHVQPRRLPPAQLHRLIGSDGRAGKDRPPYDRGQTGTGQGIPGRHRHRGFVRPVRLHHVCLDPGRHRSPGGGGL